LDRCSYCGEEKARITHHTKFLKEGRSKVIQTICSDCFNLPEVKDNFNVIDAGDMRRAYEATLYVIKYSNGSIKFLDAVKIAYEGSKSTRRYLDEKGPTLDNKRLWEFRYNLTFNEKNVGVTSDDPFIVEWLPEMD
jgi:hypothetical protein